MVAKKIRIGLVTDSYIVESWFFTSIDRLKKINGCDLVLFKIPVKRINIEKENIFFIFLKKLDSYFAKKYFNIRKLDSHVKADIRDLFAKADVIEIEARADEPSLDHVPVINAEIKALALDVLVDYKNLLSGQEISPALKYGIWRYQYDNQFVEHINHYGFWESIEKQPVTIASMVMARGGERNHLTLSRSWSTTNSISPYMNRNYISWTSSSFLPRLITKLIKLGDDKFYKEIEELNSGISINSDRKNTIPGSIDSIIILVNYVVNKFVGLYKRIFYIKQWVLLSKKGGDINQPVYEFNEILPSKDRFWADPFLIKDNGTTYLFFEEYLDSTKKGHISVSNIDESGNMSDPVKVLETDFHLSYPFVFDHNGKYYMIPETKSDSSIQLYEATEFPYKWKLNRLMMENVRAVDTTLFYYKNKWWLFSVICETEGIRSSEDLFLFYSDDIFTDEWTSHPLNPIITDTRRARPAGKIFFHNGDLIRPSQDCSIAYGRAVNFNKIEIISETDYKEVVISSIQPYWKPDVLGVHTFSRIDDLTFIDAYYYRRKLF